MPVAGTQVFVANIPWKASEDDLRRLFEDNEIIVENVSIKMGDDGRSKGFGFVTFAPRGINVSQVIEKMHGKELKGRDLTVQPARGSQPRP